MWHRLKLAGKNFKRELKVYQLVLRDERTPKFAKFLMGLAVGYALLPFDIIPDFIPVLGHLDDVIIIPVLVSSALKRIPDSVIKDCRIKADSSAPCQTATTRERAE